MAIVNSPAQYVYDRTAKRYLTNKDNIPLPDDGYNEILKNYLQFFFVKGKHSYFENFAPFWTNWTEEMPDYFANALDLTIGRARIRPFDETIFVPKSQSYNRTFEQIITTNYKQVTEASITDEIIEGSLGSAQTYAYVMNTIKESLVASHKNLLYYNILNYLLFSDEKIQSDVILPSFMTLIAQDAKPAKIITLTASSFGNSAFQEIMFHVRNMCGNFMQTNYNIGDPYYSGSGTAPARPFGYAHAGEKLSDFVLILPESMYNKYLTDVDNTSGTANIYNLSLVELSKFFNQIEYYDDKSPQISIEIAGETQAKEPTGYNVNKWIANPFLNKTNIAVVNKKCVYVLSRINKAVSQMYGANITNVAWLHMWMNIAIKMTEQGAIFKLS